MENDEQPPATAPESRWRDPFGVEMDGKRFLLWICLPVILVYAVFFLVFRPEKPVGGPSNMFGPPPDLRGDPPSETTPNPTEE